MKKIITLGNSVIDNYENLTKSFPGGNALNVAAQSKIFGAEKSSLISLIGDDVKGEKIEKRLKSLQVDISNLRKSQGKTSIVTIELDEHGDRQFLYWDKGVQDSLAVRISDKDVKHIENHDLMHTNSSDMFLAYIEKRNEKIDLSFDFSIEKDKELLKKLCPHLTFAFLSANELSIKESEALINEVHEYGAKYVIVTRGGEDALFSDKYKVYRKKIEHIKAVDTLGAGDTFISAFLSHFNQDTDHNYLLNKATKAATEVCKRYGTFGSPL